MCHILNTVCRYPVRHVPPAHCPGTPVGHVVHASTALCDIIDRFNDSSGSREALLKRKNVAHLALPGYQEGRRRCGTFSLPGTRKRGGMWHKQLPGQPQKEEECGTKSSHPGRSGPRGPF